MDANDMISRFLIYRYMVSELWMNMRRIGSKPSFVNLLVFPEGFPLKLNTTPDVRHILTNANPCRNMFIGNILLHEGCGGADAFILKIQMSASA